MFKDIKYGILSYLCQRNYKRVLKRLKRKNKYKVIFLVSENSKWGYQSLYEELLKDEDFEPLIVVYVLSGVHKGKDKTRNNLEENYNFFKSRGMNVEYAYKNHKYIDLKNFNPDIVFYEQPWGLPNKYKPQNVSKYALTCYSDYGFEFFCNSDNYKDNFHRLLWTFFVDNELNIKRYESYKKSNSKNCKSVGYPKLDVYIDKKSITHAEFWQNEEKFKIIYAPHHSFDKNGLRLATFEKTGKYILELAKKYPETTWIFKPHPQFKYSVLNNNIMTQEEIDKYYQEWKNIGKIYEQGDYFDIFITSNLMITDCASFLGEYMPTLNPIIRIVNSKALEMNSLGRFISQSCYEIENVRDLEKIFKYLLNNKNDKKYYVRKKIQEILFNFEEKSSQRILKYIKQVVNNNKKELK